MISSGNTGQGFPLVLYSAKAMTSEKDETTNSNSIRELVDSLCRDGADAQYMQYLSKSRITSP